MSIYITIFPEGQEAVTIEMGNGDVSVGDLIIQDIGALIIQDKYGVGFGDIQAQKIGDDLPVGPLRLPEVVLLFTNPESIDVVVSRLLMTKENLIQSMERIKP